MSEKQVDTIHKTIVDNIRFTASCRMCKLSKSHPHIYNQISALVMDGTSIMQVYDAYLDLTDVNDLPEASYKTLCNHFNKHLTMEAAVAIAVAKKEKVPDKVDRKLVSEKEVAQVDLGNFDEYKELCKLYVAFKNVSDKIYEYTNALQKEQTDSVDKWSQAKIGTFVQMVNTQRSILSEIAKMRQSDKLVAVAAQFILEQYTRSILMKIQEEFDMTSAFMKRHGVSTEDVEEYENLIKSRMSNILVNEAESAMNLTKKEFKLPN